MIPSINELEVSRLDIQNRLDNERSSQARNELGQFATPSELAKSIVRAALTMRTECEPISFLEPAVGTGSFYSALISQIDESSILSAQGYEIDEHYGAPSRKFWKKHKLAIHINDFLAIAPPKLEDQKYNFIISNPPYVRHHHIQSEQKQFLKERLNAELNISFSGLTGLYGYFLALTSLWLKKDGVSVWLLPGEFLDVNYGVAIKKFLLSDVKVLRIHRFRPEDLQFSDALVSSVVVFYTTGKTSDIEFSSGVSIESPEIRVMVNSKNIDPTEKWTARFNPLHTTKRSAKTIGDYFKVKRGIATGSNESFILNDEDIQNNEIPLSCIRPIVPSPRHYKGLTIEADEYGFPSNIPKNYLLDIPYSQDELKCLPKKFQTFLKLTQERVCANYLIAKRIPWYKQEQRPDCPFFLTYMGRNSKEPFRLIFNKSNATATNAYLMLFPKFNWTRLKSEDMKLMSLIHKELLSITGADFINNGRVYGGGLYKLEPTELMSIPVDSIFSETTLIEMEKRNSEIQMRLFDRPQVKYTVTKRKTKRHLTNVVADSAVVS